MRFFAFVLAGLLAGSWAPWPIPAAVASCPEPAERALADAGSVTPSLHGDGPVAVAAITQNGGKPWTPGASRVMVTAHAAPHADGDRLGAHAGRAPPLRLTPPIL
jgi:hypothetical protein